MSPSPCIAVQIHILDRIPTSRQSSAAAHANRDSTITANNNATRRKRRPIKKKRSRRRRYTHDEHATVYISPGSAIDDGDDAIASMLRCKKRGNAVVASSDPSDKPLMEDFNVEDNDIGVACLLFRRVGHHDSLWAPIIVRNLPWDGTDTEGSSSSSSSSSSSQLLSSQNNETLPSRLYVPPCLAATLGLHCFHHGAIHHHHHHHHRAVTTSRIATSDYFLRPLSSENIAKASHATLREIGLPPPIPKLKLLPEEEEQLREDNVESNNDGHRPTEEEEQLRKFFLRPPNKKHGDTDNIEQQQKQKQEHLHPKFRTKKKETRQSKPRQRLLALGSIFATPSSALDDENGVDEDVDGSSIPTLRNVRFYQVVNVQSCGKSTTSTSPRDEPRAYIVSPSTHLVLLPPAATTTTANNTDDGSSIGESSQNVKRTMMALHPQLDNVPMMNGFTWRMPRPSLVTSFLRSIDNNNSFAQDDDSSSLKVGVTATASKGSSMRDAKTSTINNSNENIILHHPSAKNLVDAFYLQGAPLAVNGGPGVVHVVGKEDNHVRACVDEAADVMGMRSFHVDGLAAFWAHFNLFRTYSKQHRPSSSSSNQRTATLTGALPDKLKGLSAALEIARRSSPCVLHVAGIDGELPVAEGHAADPDARREEEGRIMEAIVGEGGGGVISGPRFPNSVMFGGAARNVAKARGGGRIAQDAFLSRSTAPQIIVVFSTSNPLPPGPISSSLLQSSIVISAPDDNYARILWDNDADGTFEALSPHLLGLSARDIRYLRENFASRWKVEMAKQNIASNMSAANDAKRSSAPSPVDILQSLLPHLESTRAFTQSSCRGGGSSGTLPLSSSSLPNVRWQDIGGLESIRKEIMDAVELPLKYPELFEGSRRSGILLFGPPGTGKTLVAKAVARECGLPFLSIKGPELLGSYVGESEANVRAVFEAARSAAMDPPPRTTSMEGGRSSSGYSGASVLFFDELDSLAPRRGDTGHGDGVMDRVVATLLGELDDGGGDGGDDSKLDSAAHVVVIGATNRPDLLDPSLLRPGRFDRLLYLGPAKTKEHCLQILLAQTRKFRFEDEEAKTVLERAMGSFPPTLSGADLSAVASGALMRGLKRVCERIEGESRLINLAKGVTDDSDMAVDIDDVMHSLSKEELQPVMTAEDFVDAAKMIVPSISDRDLKKFERLQMQYGANLERNEGTQN